MIIVAGHITVDPERRETYLAASVAVVERARAAAGCLDFAMTADLLDPCRLNLFERWESEEAVKAFRRTAPRNKHAKAILSGSVAEYEISETRPLFEKGKREPRGRGQTGSSGSTSPVVTS